MGICLPVQRPLEIDSSVDEFILPDTEPGYPEPMPPDPLYGSFARTQHCFTNDKFNNASNDEDLFKNFTVDADDISLDLNTMSDEMRSSRPHTAASIRSALKSSRPHTAASVKSALSFHEIDEHAKKVDRKLLDSFEELIQYLTKPISSDKFRRTKTARAIVVWLSQQKLEGKSYGEKNVDTPRGLLQYLKEGKMSYTTCYALLCRKAGLQCAIVRGQVKAGGYEPGDDEVAVSSWNAVYVESGWQIVHAYWVCRARFGHNTGEWIKVEQDGKTMKQKEKASTGIEQNTFQEQYFMPSPEEFIYRCCASAKEWQLVSPQTNVPSEEEFIKKAYLHFPFFDVGFRLTSEPKCSLESKNGFCKIEMKAKPANAHMIILKYELFEKDLDGDSNTTSTTNDDVARMVFNSRAGETFTFDIRFPKTGVYKLIIYGGPHKSSGLCLCEFKIVCNQEMVGRSLLPLDCGEIGWGPGPVAAEAGLLMPSKPSGLIPVNEKDKNTDVKFQLRDINDKYAAVVHGEVGGRRKQLDDKTVDVHKNAQSNQLVVSVKLPDKGEFGLSVQHMASKKQNKEWENVCHYLMSTLAFTPERANVKYAKQKLKEAVEASVEPRRWKAQIKDIQYWTQKCRKEKVPDSDDVIITANAMVGFLFCKDKLRDCILRRNLHVIRETLSIISHYRNRDALTMDIQKVKEVEAEIVALKGKGYTRPVPKLEEANKEIVALKHAPDEVYNTLKALLVLLGESENFLEDWADIQSQMKASTHTKETSVLGKMSHLQKQIISQDRLQKAFEILHKYDENQVRKVNSDAHSFYLWMENFRNVHEGN